ncbi:MULTISPECIES: putative phage abortive infection protein [Pseudomonas]|uniref:putative phage abortive infection protein n=1 Tax=Pseudomonas TaxID=286 RepID=UPI00257F07F7|nr:MULTISPECIES: putative phage abortive infection protein [Pseudomonas]
MGKKIGSGIIISIGIFSVLSFYIIYYAFLYSGYADSLDVSELKGVRSGTFGDAFGTLNAFFSALAFSGVLLSLHFQRKDIKSSHAQTHRQQIESQFYNLLSLQQQIVQGFDLHLTRNGHAVVIQGRDCFRNWRRKLRLRFVRFRKEGTITSEASKFAYNSVLESHRGDLGLYFRSLYSIFRFIENSDGVDKKHLGTIVRSMLSDYELVLLFYNCLSKKGGKFMRFAEDYALFDNLDVKLLLHRSDLKLMKAKVFGENSEALEIQASLSTS